MSRQPTVSREDLIRALTSSKGDLVVAAVLLEVHPSTVYRAMRRYGVKVEAERRVVAA